MRVPLLVLLLLCTVQASWAQEAAPDSTATELPRNYFIPIPVIYYSPETKLAFGISGAYLYRSDPTLVGARPSTLGGVAIYTTRNQILASFGGEHYWDRDRSQVSGGVSYKKFPNDFYGLGNDTDADFSETFTDEGAGFALDYLRVVAPRVRLGGGLTLGSSTITGTEPGDALASGFVPGSAGGVVAGFGLVAQWDSRENVSYPLRGSFHQASWRLYDDAVGSDFNFSSLVFDLRRYLNLGGQRVLALRGLGSFGGGEVPFQLMPALGGDMLMRGYYGGRFRERKLVAAQGEFRFYFWKRLGAAVFGAAGQVAPELEQLRMDRFHYSYGAGLRILLIKQEGMNLRIDVGSGEDQSAFYIGFSEAF